MDTILAFQALSYVGSGKNRYQLEIPESLVKGIGRDYELKSLRKVRCALTPSRIHIYVRSGIQEVLHSGAD